MAITFNDGIYNESPKPLDFKSYVGATEPRLIFDAKEDIPTAYRFIGMVVYDVDNYEVWQLQGGTEDEFWQQLNLGGGSQDDLVGYRHIHTGVDKSVFSFPIVGFTEENTMVFVNGLELKSNHLSTSAVYDFTIKPTSTTTDIAFTFPIENNDIIQFTKI